MISLNAETIALLASIGGAGLFFFLAKFYKGQSEQSRKAERKAQAQADSYKKSMEEEVTVHENIKDNQQEVATITNVGDLIKHYINRVRKANSSKDNNPK